MSSARERIVAFHLARLKDKSAQVRLRAIDELLLLGATEAYPALEELFHNDPDPAVKKRAQEAGRKLYLLLNQPR